jgi:hypothetical protein
VLADQSLALRVLYGLVVSPWALILWVTFRKFNHMSGDAIQLFFDTIQRKSTAVFFTEDTPQEIWLFHRLGLYAGNQSTWSHLYPEAWRHHTLELDPMMWRRIRKITRAELIIIRRHDMAYDTKLRLAAIFCICSSTARTTIKEILEPLGFEHEIPFFHAAARISTSNDHIPELLGHAFDLALPLCDQQKRQVPSPLRLTLDRLECVHLAAKLPIAQVSPFPLNTKIFIKQNRISLSIYFLQSSNCPMGLTI